jgi:hypothetical protein
MADLRGLARDSSGSVLRAGASTLRQVSVTRDGGIFEADWLTQALGSEGRIFFGSQGTAQNSTFTGQTSFSATTPDLTLEVPAGTTAIPLSLSLVQTGTVAGGLITVILGIQNAAERSSGGTAWTLVTSSRTDKPMTPSCSVYTQPTVSSDTVGVRLWAATLKQDVTNTVYTNHVYWTALGQESAVPYLVGPAALKVYTFASTTGPTFFADLAWAELPSSAVV